MAMEEDELLGLFEVMDALLEDPYWAQPHPKPCSDTPWAGVECELGSNCAANLFRFCMLIISNVAEL